MGESYRGLTIRIGADSTELKNELKTATSAAAQTQKQLRALSKAMKFDDSNIDLLRRNMKYLENNAESTATKLSQIQKAINQYRGTRIEELSKEWGNVSQRAYEAKDSMNRVNNELAIIHDKMEKVAKENEIAWDKDKALELFNELRKGSQYVEDLCSQYEKLVPIQKKAQANWEEAKKVIQFDDAINEAEILKQKISQLASEEAELALKARALELDEPFREARTRVESCDSALEMLEQKLRAVDKALELDPTNISILDDRCKLTLQKATALEEKMEALKRIMAGMQSKGIDDAGMSMMELANRAARARESFEGIDEQLIAARGKVAELNQQLEEMRYIAERAGQPFDEAASDVIRLKQQISDAAREEMVLREKAEAAKVVMNTTNDQHEYAKAKAEVEQLGYALMEMKTKAQGANMSMLNGIRDFATTMSATVTPAAIMALYKIVTAIDEVDAAYRDMRKTVQGTEEQFDALYQNALKMSRTSIVSAADILEIEAMGGQLGIAVDELEDFARICSNLDIATDLNAEEVSTQLGQLNNILQWSGDDMERFSNSLVRLGNNMPTTESKITDITSAIGAAGTIFGMTSPEIAAWAATIASTGQGAEAAGTAISNTMYDIEAAVGEGGDSLAAFAEVSGMSAEQFAAAWKSDPSAALEAFIKGLKNVSDSGDSATNTLDQLEIRGVRQVRAILGLTQTIGTLDDALLMSNNAWDGISDQWGQAGDAANEAAAKAEGFSGTLSMLRNAAESLGVTVGESLTPLMKVLHEGLVGVTNAIDKVPDEVLSATTAFIAFVAAAGPAARILSQGAITLAAVKKGFVESRVGALLLTAAERELTIEEIKAQLALTKKSAAQTATTVSGVNYATTNATVTMSERAEATATETSTKAISAKALAMNAAKGAAVALAVAGIAILAKTIADAVNDYMTFKSATEGMSSAFSNSVTAAASAGNAMEGYRVKVGSVAGDLKELAKSQSEAAKKIEETSTTALTTTAQMDSYGSTIKSLMEKSNLTEAEFAKLKTAVELLSDSMGQSYSVTRDEENGLRILDEAGKDVTSTIYELIDAQKQQIMFDAAKSNYTEALNAQNNAAKTLAQAMNNLKIAEEQYDEAVKAGDLNMDSYGQQLVHCQQEVEKAKQLYNSAGNEVSFFEQQMQLSNMAMQESATPATTFLNSCKYLQGAINASGVSLMSFRDSLEQTGLSEQQLSTITEEQWTAIVGSYDGSALSIISALQSVMGSNAELVTTSEEKYAELQAANDTTTTALETNFLDAQGVVTQAGHDMIIGARDAVNEQSPGLIAAACSATGWTESQFLWLAEQCGVDGADAMTNFASSVASGEGAAYDAACQVASGTNDGLDSEDWTSTGSNVGQGFVSGIGSWIGSAIDTARRLVAAAKAAADAEADSHSPSKEMMKRGKWFDQGFAQGIEKNKKEPMLAAKKMMDESIEMAGTFNSQHELSLSYRADIASDLARSLSYAVSGIRSQSYSKSDSVQQSSDTYMTIAGDIHIETKSDNPQEIVDEIVKVFSRAQAANA